MSSVSAMRRHASAANPTGATGPVREELINLIPKLRAFSHMLCLEQDLAETLAQKAFATAWHRQRDGDEATNLTTGLFRILHEEFHSHSRRKDGSQTRLVDTLPAERPKESVSGIATALRAMSHNQREALILVTAGGFTCEDAATICGTRPRTMKSRAVRARNTLMKTLQSDRERSQSHTVKEMWPSSAV